MPKLFKKFTGAYNASQFLIFDSRNKYKVDARVRVAYLMQLDMDARRVRPTFTTLHVKTENSCEIVVLLYY